MTNTREEFEVFCRRRFGWKDNMFEVSQGEYLNGKTYDKWVVWQAARAGGEVEAVGVLDEDGEGLYARIGADDLEHTGAKIGDPVYLRAPAPVAKVPDVAGLVEALESLLDMQDEDCRYDHQGYCQNHNLDHVEDGCRVARARTALTAAPQPVEGEQ